MATPTPKMADPKERFYRHFQHQVTVLQDQIESLESVSAVGGERQDAQDAVLSAISRLSNEVMDAADFIPAYDQRAYSQAIKALTEKYNTAITQSAPKSRFQFKKRTGPSDKSAVDSRVRFQAPGEAEPSQSVATAGESSSSAGANEAQDSVSNLPSFKNYNEEMARSDQPRGVRKPSFSTAKNIAIYGHTGLHIMLPSTASRATSSGSLTDLNRCIVDMTIPTTSGAPFAGLQLKNIAKSLILAGQVAGPAHITGIKDSVIVVAARQVRMHECENVDIYLHCASHPIIEDCKGTRFAPLPECYIIPENNSTTNKWDQVDDFKWLKTEPSPNWSVMPEEKRISAEVWQKTVCGNPSLSTEDILKKVGIEL